MKQLIMMVLSLTITSAIWANKNTAESNDSPTTTTVTEKETSPEVYIYPNQNRDMIFLQTIEQFQLTLTDIDGKIILQKQQTNYLDIKNISNGIYILEMKNSKGKNEQRIITVKS